MFETRRGRRRWAGAGGVATAGALALALATGAGAAQAGHARAAADCDGADAPIATSTVAQSRTALACLIDAVRVDHGLATVRPDVRLHAAAADHAADMVRRHYFAHVTRAGAGLADRLRRVDWVPAHAGWWAGEILVLGSGGASTPQRLVDAWLASPPHRRILLDARPTLVGIGLVRNTPDGRNPLTGVTAVADFGRVCPAGGADPLSSYTSPTPRTAADACAA